MCSSLSCRGQGSSIHVFKLELSRSRVEYSCVRVRAVEVKGRVFMCSSLIMNIAN